MERPGTPLSSMRDEQFVRIIEIQSRHLVLKPICANTSRRNGHETVSKALVISSFSRMLLCFVLYNFFGSQTDIVEVIQDIAVFYEGTLVL